MHTRKTIALFVNQLEYSHQGIMWKLVADEIRNRGHNTVVFPGKTFMAPYLADSSHNLIYSLAALSAFDACIVFTGLLTSFIPLADFCAFLKTLRNCPVVSIGTKLEDFPSIIIDNASGIEMAVSHLVNEHNCRNIFYISGTEQNLESVERLAGYKKGLSNHNMAFRPELVYMGDFTLSSGRQAAEKILQTGVEQLDAIISANDDMLLAAIEVLNNHQVRIPEDLAVIGFDNTLEAQVSMPGLSSIRQPEGEIAAKAAEAAIALAHKKHVPDKISLPVKLICRESCGCLPASYLRDSTIRVADEKIKIEGLDLYKSLVTDLTNGHNGSHFLKRLQTKLLFWLRSGKEISNCYNVLDFIEKQNRENPKKHCHHEQCNEILQRARLLYLETITRQQWQKRVHSEIQHLELLRVSRSLITCQTHEDLLISCRYNLPLLGITWASVLVFQDPPQWSGYMTWKLPEKIKILGTINTANHKEAKTGIIDTSEWLPSWLFEDGPPATVIVMGLFFNETYFGFMLMKEGITINSIYETIRGQISSALSGIDLINKQQEISLQLRRTIQDLKESRDEIERISITDELTGLYNRRGFYMLGESYLAQSRRNNSIFTILYFDLDNLKLINDSYGHDAGDQALIQFTTIMQSVFRDSDILARIGGDEFVVLTPYSGEKDIFNIQKRFARHIENFQESVDTPYIVSASLGHAVFSPGNNQNLDMLLKTADEMLYSQKKKRK